MIMAIGMESLFDTTNLSNQKPLRIHEPLIRFSEDKPQPRRLLDGNKSTPSEPKPVESIKLIEPKKPLDKTEDLKRKIDPPSKEVEPARKKQQKQTSIMNFFGKKP